MEHLFAGSAEPSLSRMQVLPRPKKTPKKELTTGATFANRYQIIEELGKGGMGRVYKALDKEVNAKIALKLIKPEIASDKETIQRFRNELKTARDISHKNVCRMYDLNREEESYYITMEYVSGEDLKSFIRRSGQLSMSTAVKIAKQICDGLSEAHKLGVVHRDLKPQNIMIDNEGNVRIMDFGIVRSLSGKGITGAGVMIGTPEYMSPEQAEGKEVDQRSDIYSLGIILYEMVTGKVPFEGDTPFAIGMKHKSEIPQAPKQINAQIPEGLQKIILKCLEKDKKLRYQSCEELLDHLKSSAKDIETTVSDVRRPVKPAESRRKRTAAFVGVLLILLIIIAVWIVINPSGPRWSKDEALAEIEELVSKDNYWEAFLLASEAESHIPDDPDLEELWEKLSGKLSVTSTPLGADISIRGYFAEREAWQHTERHRLKIQEFLKVSFTGRLSTPDINLMKPVEHFFTQSQ